MKAWLSQRSIAYREVDVSRDPAAAAEMVRLSGQQGVPVTVVDGQAVVGFDPQRLEARVAAARRPRLGAARADAAQMAAPGRTTATQGAYIGRIRPGGAAERAGLAAGDVIVSLANREVRDAAALEGLLPRVPPGRDIPLAYLRGGERRTTSIRF